MLSTFNEILQQSIQKLMPCQLCGLNQQQFHSLCHDCWEHLPWFKQTIQRHERTILIAQHYQFPIDRIIQKFKYEQQLHYQTLLAHSLLELRLPRVQAIVPMPISTQRLIERGYNQSLILAKIISKKQNIPIWQPVIREAQHSQKGLTGIERLQNIENQFTIIQTQRRKYKKVLIIDDVITTGSSVNALAQALERLGCQHIHIACIAAAEQA